ncbi:MAG: glycosyltransferase [Chloroflexi bacterium]|nr:glycosyltransferase [Chloroflexota bacterium]
MKQEIIIVTPVYNDWQSFNHLADEIASLARLHNFKANLIAVDDGSANPPEIKTGEWRGRLEVQIARLSRNLGHQRAIAVGLVIASNMEKDLPIIVMDCDGEDQPTDILRLLAEREKDPDAIVFARRAKRSESRLFRLFYFFFKLIFRILTGKSITFGNYCLIPPASLDRIVHLQEIWNHFPAGVMHSGLPWTTIPTTRGKRYAGKSRMNMVALVLHGISAVSVYVEIAYVRLIFFSLLIMLLDFLGFLVLLYVRYFTPLAIPGWATSVAIGLTVIMIQAFLFLGLLSFIILSYRSVKMFIPAVDYKDYLLSLRRVKSK